MDLYAENILDHYKNPRNKKKMDNPDMENKADNPLCGDSLSFYIKLKGEAIQEITFEGHGCAISQSAASMLTETLEGKTIKEAKKITKDDAIEMLGVEIGPTRLKCALLGWNALQDMLSE
jgi:nitrogen fixation NifU-like protein